MPRWVVGELLTGRITADVHPSKATWSYPLNGAGSIQATVPLAQYDNDVPGQPATLDVRNRTLPWRTFLGALSLDPNSTQVYQAGPIIGRPWDDDAQAITLVGAGMWAYLFRRVLAPLLAPGQRLSDPLVTTLLSGYSLGGIAVKVMEQMLGVPSGGLPIDLPAAELGTRKREYPGYDAALVGDRLKQLIEVINGPDIMFKPYLADPTHLRWKMQVGTEADPFVHSTAKPAFNYSAAGTNASGLSTDEDSSRMTTHDFELGGDQENEVLAGMATDSFLLDHGWPRLDSVTTRSSVGDLDLLDLYAQEAVLLGRSPTESWTLKFNTRERPYPSSYECGDFGTLRIKGSRWVPDSPPDRPWDVRIVALSGDQDDQVIGVSFQEMSALG